MSWTLDSYRYDCELDTGQLQVRLYRLVQLFDDAMTTTKCCYDKPVAVQSVEFSVQCSDSEGFCL